MHSIEKKNTKKLKGYTYYSVSMEAWFSLSFHVNYTLSRLRRTGLGFPIPLHAIKVIKGTVRETSNAETFVWSILG